MDDMDGIVIVMMLAVAGWAFVQFMMFRNGMFNGQKKEECSLHSWSYNHEHKLQCVRCNFVANKKEVDKEPLE